MLNWATGLRTLRAPPRLLRELRQSGNSEGADLSSCRGHMPLYAIGVPAAGFCSDAVQSSGRGAKNQKAVGRKSRKGRLLRCCKGPSLGHCLKPVGRQNQSTHRSAQRGQDGQGFAPGDLWISAVARGGEEQWLAERLLRLALNPNRSPTYEIWRDKQVSSDLQAGQGSRSGEQQ